MIDCEEYENLLVCLKTYSFTLVQSVTELATVRSTCSS